MCMEDIRIGRATTTHSSVVSATGPITFQLCGSDELRTRLVISGDGSTAIWVGPLGSPLANLQGFVLNAGYPHEVFRIEDWGDAITGPWSAFVQAGTVHVQVTEVSLNKR